MKGLTILIPIACGVAAGATFYVRNVTSTLLQYASSFEYMATELAKSPQDAILGREIVLYRRQAEELRKDAQAPFYEKIFKRHVPMLQLLDDIEEEARGGVRTKSW